MPTINVRKTGCLSDPIIVEVGEPVRPYAVSTVSESLLDAAAAVGQDAIEDQALTKDGEPGVFAKQLGILLGVEASEFVNDDVRELRETVRGLLSALLPPADEVGGVVKNSGAEAGS